MRVQCAFKILCCVYIALCVCTRYSNLSSLPVAVCPLLKCQGKQGELGLNNLIMAFVCYSFKNVVCKQDSRQGLSVSMSYPQHNYLYLYKVGLNLPFARLLKVNKISAICLGRCSLFERGFFVPGTVQRLDKKNKIGSLPLLYLFIP